MNLKIMRNPSSLSIGVHPHPHPPVIYSWYDTQPINLAMYTVKPIYSYKSVFVLEISTVRFFWLRPARNLNWKI